MHGPRWYPQVPSTGQRKCLAGKALDRRMCLSPWLGVGEFSTGEAGNRRHDWLFVICIVDRTGITLITSDSSNSISISFTTLTCRKLLRFLTDLTDLGVGVESGGHGTRSHLTNQGKTSLPKFWDSTTVFHIISLLPVLTYVNVLAKCTPSSIFSDTKYARYSSFSPFPSRSSSVRDFPLPPPP